MFPLLVALSRRQLVHSGGPLQRLDEHERVEPLLIVPWLSDDLLLRGRESLVDRFFCGGERPPAGGRHVVDKATAAAATGVFVVLLRRPAFSTNKE